MPVDTSHWQGINTLGPDCSDASGYPWGFDTFAIGTVGNAVLSWFMNTWGNLDCDSLSQTVIDELNWYMNDTAKATKLAEAWLQDYVGLLGFWKHGLGAYEDAVKGWLQKQMLN